MKFFSVTYTYSFESVIDFEEDVEYFLEQCSKDGTNPKDRIEISIKVTKVTGGDESEDGDG